MPRRAVPFWDRVDRTDGCWLWTGGTSDGYGTVVVRGRTRKAHRRAWELTRGSIPEGLSVLHKCDNPRCVNPEHLFLGAIADNNADRHAKGRSRGLFPRGAQHPAVMRKGERHWAAKLTDRDVVAIRAGRAAGASTTALGRDFGVHPATISRIARGEWRQEVIS